MTGNGQTTLHTNPAKAKRFMTQLYSQPLLKNRLPSLLQVASVEWSPKVLKTLAPVTTEPTDPDSTARPPTFWVLPDLPQVYSPLDRQEYFDSTTKPLRIQTVATSAWSSSPSAQLRFCHDLLTTSKWQVEAGTRLMLVGGNNKNYPHSMSSVQAARMIRYVMQNHDHQHMSLGAVPKLPEVELWGVLNPNDPFSVARLQDKLQAGMTGFISQPPLSSKSWDVLREYQCILNSRQQATSTTTNLFLLIGMTLPQSVRSLQFWAKLLQEESSPLDRCMFEDDELFQHHAQYFEETSRGSRGNRIAALSEWVQEELDRLELALGVGDVPTENCCTRNITYGIHWMPLANLNAFSLLYHHLYLKPNIN